ncbi:unnamed protein product [Prorocentrum cordatum]|uniref:Uncharacterized protein n=1 Tax=Prorocentrum cordatum TaxID=2364126 RepID=A0ABN9T2M2_9DINO|nr:unnamed protein product [Polarella glacialis]
MPEPQDCAYPRPAAAVPPWVDDAEPPGQQQPRVLLAPHRTSEPRRAAPATPACSSAGARAEPGRRDAAGGDAAGGALGPLVGAPAARTAPGADGQRGSGDGASRDASERSRASAMRRCRSMPATPTVTKKGRGGSGHAHHKAAAATTGAAAARARARRGGRRGHPRAQEDGAPVFLRQQRPSAAARRAGRGASLPGVPAARGCRRGVAA